MSVQDFIIYVYCCVDGICRTLAKQPLRSQCYFCNHRHGWFPRLGSRANFAKQSANAWALKKRIQDAIAWQTGAMDDPIQLVDGFPIRHVNPHRHHFGGSCWFFCILRENGTIPFNYPHGQGDF